MEQCSDFSYTFTVESGSITEELLESMRIWPQTRICYVLMNDGTFRIGAIADKLLIPGAIVNEHGVEWKVSVKWTCKNNNE